MKDPYDYGCPTPLSWPGCWINEDVPDQSSPPFTLVTRCSRLILSFSLSHSLLIHFFLFFHLFSFLPAYIVPFILSQRSANALLTPPPTSTATYFSSTALLLCPSPVLSRHSPRPPFVHYDRSFPALFARALSSLAPNISELVSMISRSSRMLRLMAKRGGDETATYQGSLRLYEDESSDVALVRQVQGIDLTCCAFNSKVEKLRSKLRKN